MRTLVVLLLLAGCQNLKDGANLSACSALGPCNSTTSASVSGDSPFSLDIKSFWEGDTSKAFPTSHSVKLVDRVGGVLLNTGTVADLSNDLCRVSPGTSINSPAANRILTCGVAIPETQLFYSGLDFVITVSKNAQCGLINYQPYGYLASTDSAFTSRWQTSPLDCSGVNRPVGCFSGPITDIPGFPLISGGLYETIFDKTKNHTKIWSIPSGNSKLREDNKWTAYRRTAVDDFPVYINWEWTCTQEGSSLNYGITLRIIPVRDSPVFNPDGMRYFGWQDDNGNDL